MSWKFEYSLIFSDKNLKNLKRTQDASHPKAHFHKTGSEQFKKKVFTLATVDCEFKFQ